MQQFGCNCTQKGKCKMFDPKNPRICDIDMSDAKYLDSGSFGSVYEVYPGFVIKTGDVDYAEVQQQEYLASCDLALPVLDHTENCILTYKVDYIGWFEEEDEDDYFDFKCWIEEEWYNAGAISHLDDHDGNWGVWVKEDGTRQFVWLDCDPDWSCDSRCEECNCAIVYEFNYHTDNGSVYCEDCWDNMPKCEECQCQVPSGNGTIIDDKCLCLDCANTCEECGFLFEEDEIDIDTRLCPECLEEMKARHTCVICSTGCVESGYPTRCPICKENQPFLPGLENAHLISAKYTDWKQIFTFA